MKYRCEICDEMIEEIDIHEHIFWQHEQHILDEVWANAMHVVDKFVDYKTEEKS